MYSGVFLYNAGAQTNLLVSRKFGTTATVASATSDTPVINLDGTVIAFRAGLSSTGSLIFQSGATNLSTSIFKANSATDIFAFDTSAPGLTLVSRSAAATAMAGVVGAALCAASALAGGDPTKPWLLQTHDLAPNHWFTFAAALP